MKRFLLLGLFCLFIGHIPGLSQTQTLEVPNVAPVSPEAAALARYINYPVSYHTGLPQINIPLFEVKLNDFTLPITLSYHSGGYKLNDQPGWVGMGWTLNAEPTITRRVNALPDEKQGGYIKTTKIGAAPTDVTTLSGMAQGIAGYDYEPDDFYYSLTNASGAFVFTRTQAGGDNCALIKYPYTPVDIATGNPRTSSKFDFVLKDADGHTYDFVKADESNLEYSGRKSDMGIGLAKHYISAWKASQIITRNNHLIGFSYFPEEEELVAASSSSITITDANGLNRYTNLPTVSDPYCELSPGFWKHPVMEEYYPTSGSKRYEAQTLSDTRAQWIRRYINCTPESGGWNIYASYSRRLEKITFPGGEIIAAKQNKQLKSLTLKNGTGAIVKKINFYHHSYGEDGSRWLLDSIVVYDSRNIAIERYKFTYMPTSTMPALYRGGATDYFGYYLGDGTITTVDKAEIDVYIHEANKRKKIEIGSPEGKYYSSSSTNGLLKRIDYPTGGYTEFEFEPNQADVYDSRYPSQTTKRMISGNRIKRMKHTESAGGDVITTEYKYGKLEDGMGFLHEKIDPQSFVINQTKIDRIYPKAITPGETAPPEEIILSLRTYNAMPVGNLLFDSGAPVCYDYVTEYRMNNGVPEGKTVYNYGLRQNSPSQIVGTNRARNYRGKGLNGQLLSQRSYKYVNGQYAPVYAKHTDYIYPLSLPVFSAIAYQTIIRPNGDAMNSGDFNYREITDDTFCDYTLVTRETEKNFIYTTNALVPADSVVKTSTFEYDKGTAYGAYFPVRTVTDDSKGLSLDTRTQYATSPSALLTKNWVSAVSQVQQLYNGSTSVLQNTYSTFNNNSIVGVSGMSLTRGGNLVKQATIDSYDQYGNPQQRTLPDGVKEVYLWSYKGQYPIAYIYNADYATVESVLGFYDVADFRVKVNPTDYEITTFIARLRTDYRLANAQVTTYIHKPLIGVSTVIDPNNQSTHYEYDSFGRLAAVRDNELNIVSRNNYHYQNNNDLETVLKPVPVLTKNISGTNVRLDWNTSSGYTYEVQYFNYYDSDRTYKRLAYGLTSGNYTFYDNSSSGGYYYFRVLACKGSSKVASNEVYAEIKKLPQTFSAYADRINAQSAYIYWSASDITNQASGGTFTVQRAVYKSSGYYYDYDYTTVASYLDWRTSSYTDNSRQSGVQYVYRVTYTVSSTDIRSNTTSPV